MKTKCSLFLLPGIVLLVMLFPQCNQKNGERILPVFFSDNYISLMPGEENITMKIITGR